MDLKDIKEKYRLSQAFIYEKSYEGYSPSGAFRAECMLVEDVQILFLIVGLETCMDFASEETKREIQAKLDLLAKAHDITYNKPDF